MKVLTKFSSKSHNFFFSNSVLCVLIIIHSMNELMIIGSMRKKYIVHYQDSSIVSNISLKSTLNCCMSTWYTVGLLTAIGYLVVIQHEGHRDCFLYIVSTWKPILPEKLDVTFSCLCLYLKCMSTYHVKLQFINISKQQYGWANIRQQLRWHLSQSPH